MQTPIYGFVQNTDAQHQACLVEMAAGDVFALQSSKGISSICLGKWVRISQKSAWKIGHAIRQMMYPVGELLPALSGIVYLYEKYVCVKPRYHKGVVYARGKGTKKQCIFIAVERYGPVRTTKIGSDSIDQLTPVVHRFVHKDAHLMIFLVTKSKAWTTNGMTNDLNRSLERMKTDYVDLYFVHSVRSIDELSDEYKKVGRKSEINR